MVSCFKENIKPGITAKRDGGEGRKEKRESGDRGRRVTNLDATLVSFVQESRMCIEHFSKVIYL